MTERYVPILKAKAGEIGALREVNSTGRNMIDPMIDVAPWTPTETAPRPRRFVEGLASGLAGAWAQTGPVYLDLSLIGPAAYADGDPHQLAATIAAEAGLRLVPVVRPNRPSEVTRVSALGFAHGLCIRIRPENAMPNLAGALATLLHESHLTESEIDLVVDLGPVREDADHSSYFLAHSLLNAIPGPTSWRSVTLAASSFPINLGMIDRQGQAHVRRGEWALWHRIRQESDLIVRLQFGDYAISHPDFPEEIRQPPPPSARYTVPEQYFLVKRRRPSPAAPEPQRELARYLVSTPEYQHYGPTFSWGDREIMRYSEKQERDGTGWGGGREWRKIGTSHHLAVVVSELGS